MKRDELISLGKLLKEALVVNKKLELAYYNNDEKEKSKSIEELQSELENLEKGIVSIEDTPEYRKLLKEKEGLEEALEIIQQGEKDKDLIKDSPNYQNVMDIISKF